MMIRRALLTLAIVTTALAAGCRDRAQAPTAPAPPPTMKTQPPTQAAPLTPEPETLAPQPDSEPASASAAAAEPPEAEALPDPYPDRPEGEAADLFRQGNDLADADQWVAALSMWRWATVEILPDLRGLGFRWPVQARFMDRSDLLARVEFELAKEYPPERMRADAAAYAELGFFGEEYDLSASLTQMYTEEIAGFYDPDTKELYLIRGAEREPDGLLDQLLSGLSNDTEEQRAILAHEVAHALADQHFDLLSLQRSVEHDDDMSLALTGLVEGEAMVVMVLAMLPPFQRRDFLGAPPALTSAMMELFIPVAAVFAAGDAFNEAPGLLRETMLVPYTQGIKLALTLLQERGWEGLNAAFSRPPLSTEQLLHPRTALLGDVPDPPIALKFAGALPAALAD